MEKHPVFCPNASSCSTSGSDASLSEPLMAISGTPRSYGRPRRPSPTRLLATLDAAEARHDEAAGAEAAGAATVARRLSFEHFAREPRRERTVLRGRRADHALQHTHEATHRVGRAIAEIIDQGRLPVGTPVREPSPQHGPL